MVHHWLPAAEQTDGSIRPYICEMMWNFNSDHLNQDPMGSQEFCTSWTVRHGVLPWLHGLLTGKKKKGCSPSLLIPSENKNIGNWRTDCKKKLQTWHKPKMLLIMPHIHKHKDIFVILVLLKWDICLHMVLSYEKTTKVE